MKRQPLPQDEQSAFYVAGQGVLATRFGIEITSLSIKPQRPGLARTRLAPLKDWCKLANPHGLRTIDRLEAFVTTLLGGPVGLMLRVETNMGYKAQCTGQRHVESDYWAKVRSCKFPQAELALVLIIGWLGSVDEGNSMATLQRLWKRANRMLRNELNREALDRLAARLKKHGELSGREVAAILG